MRSRAEIVHLDLDAFFASVEQRQKPSLRGRPVIVGGLGPRGVVSTASYEARAYGVHSAMPMVRARALCPDGVYLVPRFAAYQAFSAVVMGILRATGAPVEQLSLDEAFLDAAAMLGPGDGDAGLLAERLRRDVLAATGLTASAGVASSKLVAKLASDAAKPDGVRLVSAGQELAFLHPQQVGRLHGVGPATVSRLAALGVQLVSDLADLDPAVLVAQFGPRAGLALAAMANGEDDRNVAPERERRSVSQESTFERDVYQRQVMEQAVEELARGVAQRLQAHRETARGVTVKVRTRKWVTLTRSAQVGEPTDDGAEIARVAKRLLGGVQEAADGVRLLGVGCYGLSGHLQLRLPYDLGDATPAARPEPAPAKEGLAPGVDVQHDVFGRGWVTAVQNGWASVRFETQNGTPGRIRDLDVGRAPMRRVDPEPPAGLACSGGT